MKAHAVAEGTDNAEDPMDIIVNVIDQNDNSPIFEKSTYIGEVAEASPIGNASGFISCKPEKNTPVDGFYFDTLKKQKQ